MIVNWKKRNAGVLVLPCMQGSTRVKVIHILPGHNDVPDADWMMARDSAKRHMKDGVLVEMATEKKVTVEKKVKAEKPKSDVKDGEVDLLTEDHFPFKDVVQILKDEDMFEAIALQKKEEDGKKNLTKKWLVDYMKDVEEDWVFVLSKLITEDEDEDEEIIIEETGEIEIIATALVEMDPNEATEIIADTWNLDTLEKWKKEISQPDLRVLIINQIEEVNKPPKNHGKN